MLIFTSFLRSLEPNEGSEKFGRDKLMTAKLSDLKQEKILSKHQNSIPQSHTKRLTGVCSVPKFPTHSNPRTVETNVSAASIVWLWVA